MSFNQRNIVITLVNFTLIQIFYLITVFILLRNDSFNEANVFRLFGVVIFFSVVVSFVTIFLVNFAPTIWQAIKTEDQDPEFEYLEDERDKLIELRGTKVTYMTSSFGSLIAMLSFVFGQAPLTMFCLLIFFGLLAQILGDITRLSLYRRGI